MSKEQEALEIIKDYTRTDNAYVITIVGESIKILEQALKDLELYKKIKELNDLCVESDFDELEYLARKELNDNNKK